MPTYEYECTRCGHQFETVQSMKDPHLKDCPQEACEGPLRRKIGRGAGIIFKGTGFYITDYRSDSYKAAAKKDSAGESSSSTSSTSTTSSSTGSSGGASSSPPPASSPPPSSGPSTPKAA